MSEREVTLTDIDGLKDRVRTIDRLYDSFVKGPFILSNCTVAESLSVGYPFQNQNISVSNVSITEDTWYPLDVKGNVRITRDAEILGNTNIGGALYVDNYTTLHRHATFDDYVKMNSSLHVLGKVRGESDTSIYGNVYLNKRLDVSGNTSVWTDLEVLQRTTLQGNSRVFGNTYMDKRLDVSGNTSIWTDLEVIKKSTFQDNTTFNRVNTFNGSNTIVNSSILDLRSTVNITGNVNFLNENAGKTIFLDMNTPIVSRSSIEVVTLKYAQLDRYATTAQIFTGGQSVNRLVVRDFINPSSNVSSSTNSTNIEGSVAFQTNVTMTNNGNGTNISSEQIRKIKIGTALDDQIEYNLFANDKSKQSINGTFDMTTTSILDGIKYTGNVILSGKTHTLNSSNLRMENDNLVLTSKSGTYNIQNTIVNQTNCDTKYIGRMDLNASFIDTGISYVGPAFLSGTRHRINSSNTSLVCDYFSMNAPSGSITATPTDVNIIVKKGIVEIDQAKIQITQGTFDLNSKALGLGIQYVGNLDLSGNMVVQGNLRYSSLLTNASIRELNLSVYRGTQWIENTSLTIKNVSLNLNGRSYLEGIYDMNTSAQGTGIVYKGNLNLTGNNTLSSNLTNISMKCLNVSTTELNLSVYRGLIRFENMSITFRNTSFNLSGRTYLEGVYDMNTSAQGTGIIYKGDVNLTGKNTIVSSLTNVSITEMNMSVYRGLIRIENMSINLQNTSFNLSGRAYLEGVYDMNTSAQGTGIIYKGDVNLTGKNTIVSSLTNVSITEMNMSVYRGIIRFENMSMTLQNTSLNLSGRTYLEGVYDMNTYAQGAGIIYKGDVNLTGKNTIVSTLTNASITEVNLSTLRGTYTIANSSFDITGRFFMTGTTKLDGNVSFVSDKAIDIRPSINITTRDNYTQPSILIDNPIASDDMFLRMKNSTNHVAFGRYGLQLLNKLRVGYDVSLNSSPPDGFTKYQLDVSGTGHFTGNMEFDQNVQILKTLNCSQINTYGSSILLTSGNLSTTGNILVNKIDATGNMLCKAIDTQNNTVTMGTGILTLSGDINCSKIDTFRSSIRGGSINALNLSCLTIEKQNNSVYLGTGTLFGQNLICSKLSTSSIELIGDNTTIGLTQMKGNLSMIGSTQMNGSLAVTNNISCKTLNTGTLSVGTIGNTLDVNIWGTMTANNFTLNNGEIECKKINASNGTTILGNNTQRVSFDLGTMSATGNVNVSGDLNLTGKFSSSNNVVIAGSINVSGGMFANSLRTPAITVDNLNIRSSDSNNNRSYYFNDRGDINASSVNCDNDSKFLKIVTASEFKTIPIIGTTSSFSVTNPGLLTCFGFNATSDNAHVFGTSDTKKVTLSQGTITTSSDQANIFGPVGKQVKLTGGNIVVSGTDNDASTGNITATGAIAASSLEKHRFGTSSDGYVDLKRGTINAVSEKEHVFGTNSGKVTFMSGVIRCTPTGPHLFGSSIGSDGVATATPINVKIDNGAITSTGNITATGTINGTIGSVIGGVTLGDISSGNIKTTGAIATGTVTATGEIKGNPITSTTTISATGTISGGSITTNGTINGGTGSVIGGVTLGDISSGNIKTTGAISTGTVTATGEIKGNTITSTGNITASVNITATGTINGGTGSSIGGVTLGDTASGNIKTTGSITAATFKATSDKRVKTKIQDLDPEHSRRILRALRPKTYDFTNHEAKGCIGFIAQDIQSVGLPVNKSKGIIGNIRQDVICKEGWFCTEFPLHLGDLVKLGENTHEIVDYKEGMFRVQEPFTGIYPLYGIQVDDFLSIEPNAIFTVAVSALQAMDSQMKTQQEQIQFLIQIVGTVIFFSLGASIYVLLK